MDYTKKILLDWVYAVRGEIGLVGPHPDFFDNFRVRFRLDLRFS